MPRQPQPEKSSGSQKWLQALINNCPALLNQEIAPGLRVSPESICWLSPLRDDDYSEYYDKDFLDKLDIRLEATPLNLFWPRSGPRWDGLGTTDGGTRILVEAKSHVKELNNTTSASDNSLEQIHRSLDQLKDFIGLEDSKKVDWTAGFYQYANRLAHLYLLSELNGNYISD